MKTLLLNGIIILFLAPVLYNGTFSIFKRGTIYLGTKSVKAENPANQLFNQMARIVKRESVEQGSGIGSNVYISLWYDCRKKNIKLNGIMPNVQHWSFTAYDLGTSLAVNSWIEKDSSNIVENDEYSIILTQSHTGKENELDVSEAPIGLMLLRLTNLDNDENENIQVPLVAEI